MIVYYFITFIYILLITVLFGYNKYFIIYNIYKNKLYSNANYIKKCLNNRYVMYCNAKEKYDSKIISTRLSNIYNKNYIHFLPIVEPSFSNSDIIVGIPCSPNQLIGRIAIRETYEKIKIIDEFTIKYIFATGLSTSNIYNDYLKAEARIFNDIVMFNMFNSYHNLTYTMLSLYMWILKIYPNIKYFIRCNLDTLFIPHNLNKILKVKYDVIGEFYYEEKEKILYPQGSFYIFSINILNNICKSLRHYKLSRFDDVIYGKIIKNIENISVYDLYKTGFMYSQIQSNYSYHDLTSTVAIHPLNPTVLLSLYSYLKN